jgi:hypothetical protein
VLEETHLRKIFQDETLQDRFIQTGYARIPMLAAAEVAETLAGVQALRPADRFAPSGVSPAQRGRSLAEYIFPKVSGLDALAFSQEYRLKRALNA